MNPTLTSYEEKVSQAEQLAQNEALSTDKTLKKELFVLTQEMEKEEAILAKNILKSQGQQALQHLQQRRKIAIEGIDFSDIEDELDELKGTTTQGSHETPANQTKITAPTVENTSATSGTKQEKPGLWQSIKDKRNDFGEKHPTAQKVAVGATIVGGGYMLGKWFGWRGGDKAEKKEKSTSSWWKKGLKWLGIGALGVGVFSQRDNISNRFSKLLGKENITDNKNIDHQEEQMDQRKKLTPKQQQAYTSIGHAIVDYHISLDADYDADTLNPLNPMITGINPMLLDGMYDDIGEIHSMDSFHREKWKHRRTKFNNLIEGLIKEKSSKILQYIAPDALVSIFGLDYSDVTDDGLTQGGRESIQTQRFEQKDHLRHQQMRGFIQTKTYLSHVEDQLLYQITSQELQKQGKTHDDEAIKEALDDEKFVSQYVNPLMDTLYYDNTLVGLSSVLETYTITNTIDPDTQNIIDELHEQKHDLKGDLFSSITTEKDITTHQSSLLTLSKETIAMTTDVSLREATEVRFTDIFKELYGDDDMIAEHIKDDLGTTQILDGYTTEIAAIQNKIESGTATMDDIHTLEMLIESFFQLKKDIMTGIHMGIEVDKRDGISKVRILSAGETLVEWIFQKNKTTGDYIFAGGAAFILSAGLPGYAGAIQRKVLGKTIARTAGIAFEGGKAGYLRSTASLRRRLNHRLSVSRIKGVNRWRFTTPDAMIDALANGDITLQQAGKLTLKRSTNKRSKLMRKHKKRTKLGFGDDLIENQKILLKNITSLKSQSGVNYDLLVRYRDQKTRHHLLRTNSTGTNFTATINALQKYDTIVSHGQKTQKIATGFLDNMGNMIYRNTVTSISYKHKKLLQQAIRHNKLSLTQLDVLLDEKFLKNIPIDTLSEKEITQLAKKIPSILKQKNILKATLEHADLIKIRNMGLDDAAKIKTILTDNISKYKKMLTKLTGDEKKQVQALINQLESIKGYDNKKLLALYKQGFWGKTINGIKAPLSKRLTKIGDAKLVRYVNTNSRLLGKVLGGAACALNIGISGYGLYETLQDEQELGSYNPDKKQLQLEKNIISTGLAGAELGLLFVPGVGWVAATGLAVVQVGVDAYYDVVEKYTTNLAEFTRSSKPEVAHHIISALSGRSGHDKGLKEYFADFAGTDDFDYLGGLMTDDAIEGWYRLDQIESLTPDQLMAVQFHLAPSEIQQQMIIDLRKSNPDITMGSYQQLASDIFDVVIKQPAAQRYDTLKKQLGTKTIQEQQQVFSGLALISPAVALWQGSQYLFGTDKTATSEVIDLTSVAQGIKAGKGYDALLTLLNDGQSLPTHENMKQTLPGVYHALWRYVTECYGAHIPYDKNHITSFFTTDKADRYGFYFEDGKFAINNDNERDKDFDLNNIGNKERQAIIIEIEEAVSEDDLFNDDSGENVMNQELGTKIIAIFKDTHPQATA